MINIENKRIIGGLPSLLGCRTRMNRSCRKGRTRELPVVRIVSTITVHVPKINKCINKQQNKTGGLHTGGYSLLLSSRLSCEESPSGAWRHPQASDAHPWKRLLIFCVNNVHKHFKIVSAMQCWEKLLGTDMIKISNMTYTRFIVCMLSLFGPGLGLASVSLRLVK